MDFAEACKVKALYRYPEHSIAYPWLEKCTYPWEALPHIADWIGEIGKSLSEKDYDCMDQNIWIAKTATVAKSAQICGPCIIGEGAEIRQCAFIRGNAIIGHGAVVGNSTELKNCILFDGVQVPHYNYVGDSILGYKAHMGAGAITSNVKSDKTEITIRCDTDRIKVNRKKCGAMLGDFVEIGCNSVLNPGTVVGRHANVYPLSSVRGFVPANSIYKRLGCIVEKSSEI